MESTTGGISIAYGMVRKSAKLLESAWCLACSIKDHNVPDVQTYKMGLGFLEKSVHQINPLDMSIPMPNTSNERKTEART